jgi:Ca-activated chloride channel homolog
MSFLTPLGLLGLLGVILLILIYVLKPKHQEKSVSSTFIWKLSLKYRRPKMPFQWLKSSILVFLQFLILILAALSLTTPLFALDTQSGEKIVILDISANMMTESGGRTRLDRAIQEIGALADTTTPDDKFTVILAGYDVSFLARRLDSAQYIKQLLSEVQPTFGNANIDQAISLTEGVLAENPFAEVILFTSNQYTNTGNVTVRDMSNDEWNVSILDFSAKLVNGYYHFTAEIASFNKDMDVAVVLNIDGQRRDARIVSSEENEIVTVVWDNLFVIDYSSAEVYVDYEDDFPFDNSFTIYGWENEMFNVQIVSQSPRFLQSVFLTLGNFKIDVPVPAELNGPIPVKYEGYDLYIFDGFIPEVIPIDGSIWIINPPTELDSIGINIGATLSGDFTLSSGNNLPEREQTILNLVRPNNITVSLYRYLSDYDGYTEILMIDNDPVVLAKDVNGQKIVVFAFSLHHSNLPIITDFIMLTYNLSNYSVQNMVDKNLYEAGETIYVRKKASATAMALTSDSETVNFLAIPSTLDIKEPGAYTVTQTLVTGEQVSVGFFVRVNSNQSDFTFDHGSLTNPIVPDTLDVVDANQDSFDIIYILAGLMVILLVIEWGLHFYEQH